MNVNLIIEDIKYFIGIVVGNKIKLEYPLEMIDSAGMNEVRQYFEDKGYKFACVVDDRFMWRVGVSWKNREIKK